MPEVGRYGIRERLLQAGVTIPLVCGVSGLGPASAEFYAAGAEAGSAQAQDRLKLMYLDRMVVFQDFVRARKLLCAAAASIEDRVFDDWALRCAETCPMFQTASLGKGAVNASLLSIAPGAEERGYYGVLSAAAGSDLTHVIKLE